MRPRIRAQCQALVRMPTKVEKWKDEEYGNEIREDLLQFAEDGWDAIPEDEQDAWFERFKWWGLYHQRKGQESYFMNRRRVRPRPGRQPRVRCRLL